MNGLGDLSSARLRLVVRGRVQGVCFRMRACEEARRQGVTGWVRNRSDGSVEVLAEGPAAALEALQAWCRHGPPSARVTALEEERAAATGEFADFTIGF